MSSGLLLHSHKNLFNFLVIICTSIFLFTSTTDAKELKLTQAEQTWINSHKIIKMGIDTGYGPYSFLDERGQPQGVVLDFLTKIQQALGIHFQIISNLTWSQLIQNIKEHKIDAIATVVKTTSREAFLNFTKIYISAPLVVVTRKDTPKLKSISELKSLRLSLVKDYSSSKQIMLKFPNLKPLYVTTPIEGLRSVASGKSDAYIGVLGVNSFQSSQNGINNLKSNVAMDMSNNGQRFGVRKDWPQLAQLLNKALLEIPKVQKNQIFQHWLPLQAKDMKRLGRTAFISQIFPWLLGVLAISFLGYLTTFLWNYQLKKELRQRKKNLEKAQAAAHFGDWSLDIKSGVFHWSDELFRIVGRIPNRSRELDLPTLRSWLHPNDIKKYIQYFRMLKNSKPNDSFPPLISHILQPNGNSKWLEIIGAIEFDTTNNPISFFGTALDISKRKLAEEQMQEKEEIMLTQSHQAAMGEMISLIAHQWRQPISVIAMGANNILADIELDTLEENELKDSVENIITQTKELSKTIDDFRNFFKPQKKLEIVLLKKLFEDVFDVIGKSIESSDIEIIKHFDHDKELLTYSRKLTQVFMNILSNAKEALLENTPTKRKIFIDVTHREQEVSIKISDNAGGIKLDIINKIFNPYFSTKDEKTGTGLGLYISKTIIEKHLLGQISAKNIKYGVCFEIKLPYKIESKETI